DDAVLLHVISELLLQHPPLYRQQKCWAELDDATLAQALPFWEFPHCMQVLHSLQQLGLVLCEPVSGNSGTRLLAINQVDLRAHRQEAAAPLRPERAEPPRRPAASSSGVAT